MFTVDKIVPDFFPVNSSSEVWSKQLEFVKHCRSLGIPLSDIRTLLDLKNSPEESCITVNDLISNQLELVNKRIKELIDLRTELQIMQKACSTDNTVERCGILKTLEAD